MENHHLVPQFSHEWHGGSFHSYVTKFTRGYVEDIFEKYVFRFQGHHPYGILKYIYIYIRYLDEDMGRSEPPWVSMRLVMVIYDDLDDLGGTQIMT